METEITTPHDARDQAMTLSEQGPLAGLCRVLLTLLSLALFCASWMADFTYHDRLAEKALDHAGYGERGYRKSPPWRCPLGQGLDFGGNRRGQEVQGYVCTSLLRPTEVHEIPPSVDWSAGLGD